MVSIAWKKIALGTTLLVPVVLVGLINAAYADTNIIVDDYQTAQGNPDPNAQMFTVKGILIDPNTGAQVGRKTVTCKATIPDSPNFSCNETINFTNGDTLSTEGILNLAELSEGKTVRLDIYAGTGEYKGSLGKEKFKLLRTVSDTEKVFREKYTFNKE